MDLASGIEQYTRRDWQTTNEGTVRLALIGLGWWTTDVVIPATKDSELCETTVLVSGSVEKAERLAERHGADRGIDYDAYHNGDAVDDYDAVYVGTPNAYHLEYVETAADHDKAVLCEKPLEKNVERARRLVDAATEADIPLMTAYRMHTEPAVRRARELVDSGFVGEVVHAYGNNSQPILDMIPNPDQWRLDPDVSGYGTSVMDLGIYPINTIRFLLDAQPIQAEARMSSPSEEFADVPDEYASFTLTYEGGIPLLCTTSQNAQTDTHLKIIGTEGQIELKPAFHGKATLHLSKGDLHVEVDNRGFDATEEMREEFDYFADRVLTDGKILPNGQHGLNDLRTIAAIYEAAESETAVDI